MARQKRRTRAARRRIELESRGAKKTSARRTRRSVVLALALGTTVVIAGTLAFWLLRHDDPYRPFPAAPRTADANITFEDFLGAEACASCHLPQYEAWESSTHGRAGGAPRDVALRVPFDGTPIRFRDAEVIPRVTNSGSYVFDVQQSGRPIRVLEVTAVIGGGHMVGGGTQGFVSAFPDGTIRFLPFDYSTTEQVWFCNTAGRANAGWLPITSSVALDDCADWPPVRLLGSHPEIQNCQQCHGSQIVLTEQSAGTGFRTRVKSYAVNCESCHGPGRRHVESVSSGRYRTTSDIGMTALATTSKDESLAVCFQCHSLKAELASGFLPGMSVDEYYSFRIPVLSGAPLFPDGRVRTFAYQQNHLSSACYYAGSMTCTDCHDPHSQGYRNHVGTPLADRFSDGQCLSCHPSKTARPEAHTHHASQSPGSICVACHMPYLQQPSVGRRIRYARSDHTISIPRPLLDERFGIEGACRRCHEDRTPATLQADLQSWYGPIKPPPEATRRLMSARGLRDRLAAASLVLTAERTDRAGSPLTMYQGLAHFFIRYLRPEMEDLDEETERLLRHLARSPDDDAAALALAGLHLARGTEPNTRRYIIEVLTGLGSRHTAVRRRWIEILTTRGRAYQITGDIADAIVTYRKVLQLDPASTPVRKMLRALDPSIDP